MKNNSLKSKPVLVTVIAVVLLIVLIVISAGSRSANVIESAAGTVLTPIQGFAVRASNAIAGFFGNLFNTTDADEENARLKSELAVHSKTVLDLEEAKQENERLRRLLNYAGSIGEFNTVTARVSAKSTGVWFEVFTINAGRNKGIDIDMPVICADGLVGVVTEVGATWCKVTSIIDSTMAVPIMVERTRDGCMLRGVLDATKKTNTMELYYLPSDRSDLIPGDTVITSGVGGVYPKGIKVGVVTEVMTSTGSGVNAIVPPSVDFQHIEEVMVIIGEGGEG
ncbi:MAG: rod shape-determining protein MreC [Clostridia bacterium]|nr:rod shape-determining protein MreC [Clostridia bacterium]